MPPASPPPPARLNVSTSVVAKRVTQLEARIGTPLFHRSTRQLRLTDAGQRMRPSGAQRRRRCRRSALAHGRERSLTWSIICASRRSTSLTTRAPRRCLPALFPDPKPATEILEIVLIDRLVDPVRRKALTSPSAPSRTAFGGMARSVPLWRGSSACSAPRLPIWGRTARRKHPRDLVDHRFA